MQKKRIVLAATALVVLALLFAGIGYAFNGSARTYNQGDDQTLAYMSVTPADFNAIFTGSTPFDTYVYSDGEKKTAYAFDEQEVTVVDVTVNQTTYKAVSLIDPNRDAYDLTVLNNTGGPITSLRLDITATGTVGSADFVYIFKFTNTDSYVAAAAWAEGVTYYVIDNENYVAANPNPDKNTFDAAQAGTYFVQDTAYVVLTGGSSYATISASLADTESNTIAVDVYLGYVPNIYVPTNYIGPANAAMYVLAHEYEQGVTYYADANGTTLQEQPTAQTFVPDTVYKANGCTRPYVLPTNAPEDLATTGFGIEVTDANAA